MKLLGQGSYGAVYKDCSSGKCKAIKKFFDNTIKEGYSYTDAYQEKTILDAATKILSKTQFEPFLVKSIHTPIKEEVHTEYIEHVGTLEDLKNISLNQLKAFMIQLFGSLDLLHAHGILHLDINLYNLLALKSTSKLPQKVVIGSITLTMPKAPYYLKIIDWGLAVNVKQKLFLENFINRESEDCLVPLYDFITFLKKVDSICSPEAKDFVRRIIRSIFLTDKAPKFRVGKDCKSIIKQYHLELFKYKDIFTLRDARGSLF